MKIKYLYFAFPIIAVLIYSLINKYLPASDEEITLIKCNKVLDKCVKISQDKNTELYNSIQMNLCNEYQNFNNYASFIDTCNSIFVNQNSTNIYNRLQKNIVNIKTKENASFISDINNLIETKQKQLNGYESVFFKTNSIYQFISNTNNNLNNKLLLNEIYKLLNQLTNYRECKYDNIQSKIVFDSQNNNKEYISGKFVMYKTDNYFCVRLKSNDLIFIKDKGEKNNFFKIIPNNLKYNKNGVAYLPVNLTVIEYNKTSKLNYKFQDSIAIFKNRNN